jgi:hypothetical protein
MSVRREWPIRVVSEVSGGARDAVPSQPAEQVEVGGPSTRGAWLAAAVLADMRG